jgi:hypothetical protein
MTVVAHDELRAVAALNGVLSMLKGTGKGGLRVQARTIHGFGEEQLYVDTVVDGSLPPALLRLINEGYNVRIRPTAVAPDGRPIRLCALFAHWKLTPVFVKRNFKIPEEAIARVLEPLRRFSLAPSALIDSSNEVVAFWQLDTPIDLKTTTGRRVANDLQARLSVDAFGIAATTDQLDLDTVTVPLVGPVRDMGADPPKSTIPWMDLTRTYSLSALEGALEEINR